MESLVVKMVFEETEVIMRRRISWYGAECPVCKMKNVFAQSKDRFLSTDDFGSVCWHFSHIEHKTDGSNFAHFTKPK